MVTQQVSHRSIKCQSRLWSQRGTKVNGSQHGDYPLLRPTGIHIATKSYATLGLLTICGRSPRNITNYNTPGSDADDTRALSLRNLVSGYECGRVFSAGVGPVSPSRDAVNWLLSRFGLSVETRRQYGWLRMVFAGVHLFRAPIWRPSEGWRHAKGREHCRGEPGSSLSGGYAPDSAKAGGSSIVDEPGEG